MVAIVVGANSGVIAPISEKFDDAAKSLKEICVQAGMRVDIDLRSEKVSYKIREHATKKVPYMLIVGQKEVSEKSVTIRAKDGQQETVSLEELPSWFQKKVSEVNH